MPKERVLHEMWVGRGAVLFVTMVALAAGCGGRSQDVANEDPLKGAAAGTGSGGVSSMSAGAGGLATSGSAGKGREPAHHRPASPTDCPSERGSNEPTTPSCDDPTLSACDHDADCVDGTRGRCLASHFPCVHRCSYDVCSTDADCADNKPCECRSAGTSAPNQCITASNCRVDADCGPSGFCSPSLLGELCSCISVDYCETIGSTAMCTPGPCACGDSCGHGYFCHTPADSCLDDADCVSGTCNFDLAHQSWLCTGCLPLP